MEVLRSKVARTVTAAGFVGLALTGCSRSDTPEIEACQAGWPSTVNKVQDQTKAHAEMQADITTLVSDINAAAWGKENSNDMIVISQVPADLSGVASVIFDRHDGVFYDMRDVPLSLPAVEFCSDDAGSLHLTPEYIEASAALYIAGVGAE